MVDYEQKLAGLHFVAKVRPPAASRKRWRLSMLCCVREERAGTIQAPSIWSLLVFHSTCLGPEDGTFYFGPGQFHYVAGRKLSNFGMCKS